MCYEEGHDLLHQGGEDGGDHEEGIDDVLHSLQGGVGGVEGEADEEAGGAREEHFGHDVGGHAPVLLEDTAGDL